MRRRGESSPFEEKGDNVSAEEGGEKPYLRDGEKPFSALGRVAEGKGERDTVTL